MKFVPLIIFVFKSIKSTSWHVLFSSIPDSLRGTIMCLYPWPMAYGCKLLYHFHTDIAFCSNVLYCFWSWPYILNVLTKFSDSVDIFSNAVHIFRNLFWKICLLFWKILTTCFKCSRSSTVKRCVEDEVILIFVFHL